MLIVGEHSEPSFGKWMENYVLPRMYIHNLQSSPKVLRTRPIKGNGCLGKLAMEVARLVNDEENGCRFEVQREEHWIHTRPTWLMAVRESFL